MVLIILFYCSLQTILFSAMDELDFTIANISLWRSLKQNIYLANNVMIIMNDMISSMKGTRKHSRKAEHL